MSKLPLVSSPALGGEFDMGFAGASVISGWDSLTRG